MPQDAGPARFGGPRLQVPNVLRIAAAAGGIGWCFVEAATLTYLGTPSTIAPGVLALCDDGGTVLAIPAHYYIIYVTAAAPTVLRACRQEAWVATYTAQDCYGLFYVTDHYDIWLPLAVSLGVLSGQAALSSQVAVAISLHTTGNPSVAGQAALSDGTAKALSLSTGAGLFAQAALSGGTAKVFSLHNATVPIAAQVALSDKGALALSLHI